MKAPLFLLLSALLAPSAHAGAKDGGGGAQIVAAFRMKAYALISQIADNIPANSLCSSSTLQNALDSANVHVVETLVDPHTHQPVADASLDAWTVPGDIQLKSSSWGYFVDPKSIVPADHSVATLVIHEVYRATGTCDDDHFQLSEKVISMLGGRAPTKLTEAFEFKYIYTALTRDENSKDYNWAAAPASVDQPGDIACDKAIVGPGLHVNRGLVVNCVTKDGVLYQGLKIAASVDPYPVLDVRNTKGKKDPEDGNWFSVSVRKVEAFPAFGGDDIDNQWQVISPAHPLVLLHDITNGRWNWSLE